MAAPHKTEASGVLLILPASASNIALFPSRLSALYIGAHDNVLLLHPLHPKKDASFFRLFVQLCKSFARRSLYRVVLRYYIIKNGACQGRNKWAFPEICAYAVVGLITQNFCNRRHFFRHGVHGGFGTKSRIIIVDGNAIYAVQRQ